MQNNILTAIHYLATTQELHLSDSGKDSTNRINRVGDSLETYIKDAFARTLTIDDSKTRLTKYSQTFSWTGNSNNPPDFMLTDGDAVEVKKIRGKPNSIQLNSSYPKQTIRSDDPMISQACRDCENWSKKDLIYAIGRVVDKQLHNLWMVYGDCFVAEADTYTRIAKAIREGIQSSGIEFNETRELGRVNRVDPLGITSLRIRGMWIIKHPARIFRDLLPDSSSDRQINVIMSENKFYSFSENDRQKLRDLPNTMLEIHTIQAPTPDNPARLQNIVYIGLSIS